MSAEQRPKVSIVVPMYNVEKYVGKCLDSLLSQTLREIEVIAVDDGSPDASGAIAEGYAARDPRVKVVHRENGGLGPARNTGIEHAKGEFIGFVDSDDWVHDDHFERLYEAAEVNNADIAVGGVETWTDGELVDSERHPLAGRTLVGSDQIEPYRKLFYGRLPEDAESKPFPVAVWTGIYKTELLGCNALAFLDILSEDVFFNLQAFRNAQVVTYLRVCGYCYRKDCQESITRTYSQTTLCRYAEFFRALSGSALAEEESEECSLRACRKMIDYSRSLTFMIAKSNLTTKQKSRELRKLVDLPEFQRFSSLYPVESLPSFQLLFQRTLVNRRFRMALFMVHARMLARGER